MPILKYDGSTRNVGLSSDVLVKSPVSGDEYLKSVNSMKKTFKDMACGDSDQRAGSQESKESRESKKLEKQPYNLDKSLTRSDKKLRARTHVDLDWQSSEIYTLVKNLLDLDPKDRLLQSRALLE